MNWYYKLYELPRIKLGGMLVSLLRWVDLPCFYPLFLQADNPSEAEKEMEKHIDNLVVYNAPLRGPFNNREEAVCAAKNEFEKLVNNAKKTVLV